MEKTTMSNSEQEVEECDARNDDSSNKAGYINLIIHLLLFKEKKRYFSAKPCCTSSISTIG